MVGTLVFFRLSIKTIAYIAMGLMAVMTFADVFGRVFFNSPLGSAYEINGLFLGVAVYAGLFDVCLERDHVRIDLFDNLWKKPSLFNRLREGFVWILELIFVGILAVMITKQTIEIKEFSESSMFLPIEKWLPLLVLAVFAFIALGGHLLSESPLARRMREKHLEGSI
ncbi:MAG: TRAP transporter small permease [Magnetospiraceae bacterium]